jgi:nitrogen fixation/metabolism regulation signal transduction histidine kinase
MKFETSFLRSRVAIRIFVLFVCCAVLPIAVLGILSYSHVARQLKEQAEKRLEQTGKDVRRAIHERLYFLQGEIMAVASKLSTESSLSFH